MNNKDLLQKLGEVITPIIENIRSVQGLEYTKSLHSALSLALGMRVVQAQCQELSEEKQELVEFVLKESSASAIAALAESSHNEEAFIKDFMMLTTKVLEVQP